MSGTMSRIESSKLECLTVWVFGTGMMSGTMSGFGNSELRCLNAWVSGIDDSSLDCLDLPFGFRILALL